MNETISPPNTIPARILVVDDHPSTAATLARAVATLGNKVDVISATSGQEALEKVNDLAVDMLITDMIMPEINGLELIEKLKNHPYGQPSYIILTTAYDVPGLKVTAQRLQVNQIVIKPVQPHRICQIVTQALENLKQIKKVQLTTVTKKKFKILIADDRPDNITLLARYLENEGFSNVTAMDGVETLEKIRDEQPDLILLDINMPKKDGFTVLKEIRADSNARHIPVIILTAARIGPTDVQSGLDLGADDYVTKPFDRRELMARIRTKLRVKEAEEAIRRHNRELNLLPEIGKDLSARLNINELTDIVLRRTVETLGAMLGHIIIFTPRGPLHREYHISPSAPSVPGAQLPPLNDSLNQIKETRQSLIIADTHSDPRWQVNPDDPTHSVIIVPMFGRFDLIGLLILTHEQSGYFNLEHQLLLQAIASQAAIAVENAQLYAGTAQEQQRLAAILQSAAEAILMLDADDCLSLLNPAARKLFTDYDTKLGLPLPRGRGYDALIQLIDETCASKTPKTSEITWPDSRVFSILLTPIEEGGCVVVLHDVTHFKNLERVKNEFIATASHDLKNPLTAILGFSQILSKVGPLTETQADFVRRIQTASANMSELVQNMLDLVKIDAGMEIKRETLDVNRLMAEMADEFEPQANAKNQALTLTKSEGQLQIQGDPFQLKQALRNLIGNAIKYTPGGGVITIAAEAQPEHVQVYVKDTGPGIPAVDLPHIFDRFYRVRSGPAKDIEGNGLGLAIVKSIIEGHGGEISVASELGRGSCFMVSLPLVQLAEQAAMNINLDLTRKQ